eukprot:3509061-Rhodomonas_salina.1
MVLVGKEWWRTTESKAGQCARSYTSFTSPQHSPPQRRHAKTERGREGEGDLDDAEAAALDGGTVVARDARVLL